MVRFINKEGFIYFGDIGGVDIAVTPTQRVVIHGAKGTVAGVVGRKAIHLSDAEDRKKVQPIEKLWVDIGVSSKEEAENLVAIGDPMTFVAPMIRLAHDVVASAGFDDKVGAFVAAEACRLVSKKKPKVAVFGVSTVQEELGMRGARTSAFGIDPHAGIAIDVTHSGDYPDAVKALAGDVKLGHGAVISRGANINCVLGAMIVAAAKSHRIPYQMCGDPRATGTDANPIQVNRSGAAAALVSIPNRYMHTTVELVSLGDLETCAEMLAATILDMPEKIDFRPLPAHRKKTR
jgi:endoglucanase